MTRLETLLHEKGRLFSEELGIDVARQPFRWLLAALLFGRRIGGTIARRTYRAFERRELLTPQAILRVGRDALLPVMWDGGYVRYDNLMSDFVTALCRKLVDEYGGDVDALHRRARDSGDLEARLLAFNGIGPVTVSIFLRELRGVWPKADPSLTTLEVAAAKALGFTRRTRPEHVLDDLKALWERQKLAGYDFRNFEAALVRSGLELRHKRSAGGRRGKGIGIGTCGK